MLCDWICNTSDESSSKIGAPTKTKNVNLKVFKIIAEMNEWKALAKYITFDYKCKFDSRKWNLNLKWNND